MSLKLGMVGGGKPTRTLRRGGDGVLTPARLPAGHPEGYLEAFATLYAEAAGQVRRFRNGTKSSRDSVLPTVSDGLVGWHFIAAGVRSNEVGGIWVGLWGPISNDWMQTILRARHQGSSMFATRPKSAFPQHSSRQRDDLPMQMGNWLLRTDPREAVVRVAHGWSVRGGSDHEPDHRAQPVDGRHDPGHQFGAA